MNYLKNLLSLHKGEQEKSIVKQDIISNISFKGANLWILACAILIASIGLNVNSTAVIIGAMLISPLMGPIVGSGFALATYDFNLLKRSIKNLLIATAVGLLVSCFYFYLSPFKEVQSEILARTSPNIYDVLIAFFGGIVGAISITRVEKGNPIPGVAIATALMPPLCTAGFGLATFNLKFMAGALYLYSINCFFIGISIFLVIKYLKYQPVKTENLAFDKKVRNIITILIFLMVVPSFYLAYSLLQEKKYSQNVDRFIQNEFVDHGYTIIYKKLNFNSQPKKIELAFLNKKFDSIELKNLNQNLEKYNINNTQLVIKQNTSNLKEEILAELNKNNVNFNEKDLKIQKLSEELQDYQIGDYSMSNEIKILFPEIEQISYGLMNEFVSNDSVVNYKTIIYSSKSTIDEEKLKEWLKIKLNNSSIQLIKK